MRNTVIIIPTYYGLDGPCRKGVDACKAKGAHTLFVEGCSNVTLARNLALTSALTAPPVVDTFLLVDDDIGFFPSDAEQIGAAALRTDRLVSAIYMLSKDRPAFSKHSTGWLTGLGFCALPRKRLESLAAKLPTFKSRSGDAFQPFCQTRAEDGRWYTEDVWLCKELGGALLYPLGVTHHKESVLTVPASLLESVKTQPDVCKKP